MDGARWRRQALSKRATLGSPIRTISSPHYDRSRHAKRRACHVISLSAVEKRYGEGDETVLALSRTDIHVSREEFVVLLGPSGCGKTTLLRLMAGLIAPSAGGI